MRSNFLTSQDPFCTMSNYTQTFFYELRIYNQQQLDELTQFAELYPAAEINSKFSEKDYLGFYPRYYEIVIPGDTPLNTAFLMLFPTARLRSITNFSH